MAATIDIEKFGVSDFIHTGAFYDLLHDFEYDLEFYSKWSRSTILELCSGTGRLSIPLSKLGFEVVGVDSCSSMIEQAKSKARTENSKLQFVQADIRHLNLLQKFDTVIIPFNSLQHIYTVTDIIKVFEVVKNHLAPNGHFIFDIFNPSIHYMAAQEHQSILVKKMHLEDGSEMEVYQRSQYDNVNQVNQLNWVCVHEGKETPNQMDMRCYYPKEMETLLHCCGFQVLHKFGDFDESAFSSLCKKQIYICELA
jgi:2-polyprenyl-3-methyl-5-hydroxy-6-metoxy-1,4-benzoquinol methylase